MNSKMEVFTMDFGRITACMEMDVLLIRTEISGRENL